MPAQQTLGTNRGCFCYSARAHGLGRRHSSTSDPHGFVDDFRSRCLGHVCSVDGAPVHRRRVCGAGLHSKPNQRNAWT